MFEFVGFRTYRFWAVLEDRFSGVFELIVKPLNIASGDVLDVMTPARFFASPGLWGGLLVGGLFVAGAILLPRYRDDN